ncbi:hypothetical protein FRC08_009429 [Ceratobasidium sp. 394]|nr:hypothetical protein FRC08_009429 [Ceratobasidium sp. 394]
MLQLATTRRSLSRLHHPRRVLLPLAGATNLRWVATGGTRSESVRGDGEGKKEVSESDRVVKEYLDSLKDEEGNKAAVVVPRSDISPAATSSSSPATFESSPNAQSDSVSLGEPKSSPGLAEHADRAKQSIEMWKAATLGLLRSRAQDAAGQLSELGGKLNKVTGYDEIEALKRRVVERGEHPEHSY